MTKCLVTLFALLASIFSFCDLSYEHQDDERGQIREYSKRKVVIKFETDKCIHSVIPVQKLHEVFDVKVRPWINEDGLPRKK